MNSEFVQLLGNSLPPSSVKPHPFTNTLAVAPNGDVALLNENGYIQYSSLRNTGLQAELVRLDVIGIRPNELTAISAMEFDADGRTLLLWSESRVGIVELPQSLVSSGDLRSDEVDTNCIFTSLWDANDEGVPNLVAKASFHNSCAHCVVMLMRKDVVRMVDLRSLQSEVIPLSSNRRFVSFTFGPAIDWMKFTLVLLTSGGDVYYLCPVIPKGTVLSLAAVEELWAWADQFQPDSRNNSPYQNTVYSYLFGLFGPRPIVVDEVSGRNTFLRAGEASLSSHTEEGLLGAEADVQSALANYTPALRGPIAVRRDAAVSELHEGGELAVGRRMFDEGKSFDDADAISGGSRRAATDIATLGGVSGVAFDSAPSAPVVALIYGNGEVEIFLLDFAQVRSPGCTVHTSSSFVGPSWRSVDLSRAGLTCSAGSLLLAETVAVHCEGSTGARGAADSWRLSADPVLNHVLHATCARTCESHLLSVVWLERALEVQLEQSLEEDAYSSPLTHPTRVLPVFVLPPSTGAADTRTGHQESKASSKRDASPSSGGQLSGMVVVHDAMLGHVALFRTTTGLTSAVNLTVHTKICELQDSLQIHEGTTELAPLKEELGRATSSDQVRWKRSQQCIKKVAEGLRDMPMLDASTASALTSQPSSQNKKVLLETAQKLEREVLVPLNELAQTTLFSYEMLQETYRSQVLVLEGPEEGAAPASTTPSSLSQGLKKLMVDVNAEHELMDERVRKIQEKFSAQREKAEKYLAFAVSQREKLTKAEGLYKKQLEDWSRVVSQMNEQVAALRALSGCLPHDVVASGASSGGSPRAQPPLFSITQVSVPGSAVKSSPASGRFFRSPAPASADSPRGSSGSVLSPAFSRYGYLGESAQSFGTPLAAGKTGVGMRPYSTPTVVPVRGVESANAPPSVTPASAMFNRQYHTRHPPQVSPSPNFYSNHKASRAESTPGTTSATVGAASTVRSARTPSHFGSPDLRSPQTAGRQPRTGLDAVVLSQQDQDACTELLVSQTELLEKAQQELEDLELKLKTLRKQHSM